jgi:O-antigen ligase
VFSQAIDLIGERPIIGYGYGSERTLIESLGDVEGFTGRYAGNVVVDILLEVGLLGLVAFLAVLVTAGLRVGALVRRRATLPAEAVAWPAVAVGGLANGLGESFLMRPGGISAPATWFALSMCSAVSLAVLAEPHGQLHAHQSPDPATAT